MMELLILQKKSLLTMTPNLAFHSTQHRMLTFIGKYLFSKVYYKSITGTKTLTGEKLSFVTAGVLCHTAMLLRKIVATK